MRLLGIDFGKHIGVAVAETEQHITSPRQAVISSGTLAKDAVTIQNILKKEMADLVVIGLPLDQGNETKMSRICRMLGDRLSEMGVGVRFVDESLTSFQAEQEMKMAGLKGSLIRKAIDSEAACRILERFMEENGS